MAKRTGKTVEHGGMIYEFGNEEDAINFESCVNGGGRPASCAEQCRCISKRALARDSGLEM